MCCVTRYKDKVFSINQLISCNLCYLYLLKLNVELVLECHSSIADDSTSLLRALVNLMRSRSHQKNAVLIPIKWDHSRRKLCFTFFFSLTNLNLCVNSITRIFKIHIRRRPGTQRKCRVEAKYSPGPGSSKDG